MTSDLLHCILQWLEGEQVARSKRKSENRYVLLAIILPVAGVIAGALIEHGTDGLCRLNLVECRTPESETSQLRTSVMKLQENLHKSLEIAQACQGTLGQTVDQLRQVRSSIPSTIEVGNGEPFAQPQRISLERYIDSINALTSEVSSQSEYFERPIRQIIQEMNCLATPGCIIP